MPEDRRERGDEGLADSRVAVRHLKSQLVDVRVFASEIIRARTTGRRERRASVPQFSGERRVEVYALILEDDRQKAMHICEAGVGHSIGNLVSVELARVGAIESIYAVDDPGIGLRETVYEGLGQEQMLR
jgi:hypothetical protein